MRLHSNAFATLALSLSLIGCAPKSESLGEHAIWVTIPPQKAMVEAIAGEWASVHVMVRPGQSPETYAPSVPQMVDLAKAEIYFGVGMPLERRILAKMERVSILNAPQACRAPALSATAPGNGSLSGR